jgi:hypothetical protein
MQTEKADVNLSAESSLGIEMGKINSTCIEVECEIEI